VNIRIIAATNKNLEESISLGTFREDLYYRLNIVPLVIPPLRERKDDIPELIIQFFSKLSKPKAVEADALKLMLEYHWPGNVRELEAVIERIAIFSNKNTVTVADLPPEITQRNSSTTCSPWDLPDKGIVFEEWERHLFAKALEKAGGNMVAAAKLLGMSYRAFRYRAHAFGLKEE
jgi:transcriptional regulator with PAS, ATPase and Fis domain